MKKKLLEGQLKQILQESLVPSNETLLASTLLLAEKELSKKQSRKRISFPRFLQKQIIYIGWKIWSIQGLFLLAAVSILSDFSDYMKNPRHLARLLLCLSVAVCMTALPMLYRCARYRMQEIEAAARFSSVKLLLARLIVIGTGDLCLLTGIFLTTIIKTALPADSAILCLCVPVSLRRLPVYAWPPSARTVFQGKSPFLFPVDTAVFGFHRTVCIFLSTAALGGLDGDMRPSFDFLRGTAPLCYARVLLYGNADRLTIPAAGRHSHSIGNDIMPQLQKRPLITEESDHGIIYGTRFKTI